MKRKGVSMWRTINNKADLKELPKNKHDSSYTCNILVTSTQTESLNNVMLMYFDFNDNFFHFPNYAQDWSDVKLRPISEINKWMSLPDTI